LNTNVVFKNMVMKGIQPNNTVGRTKHEGMKFLKLQT